MPRDINRCLVRSELCFLKESSTDVDRRVLWLPLKRAETDNFVLVMRETQNIVTVLALYTQSNKTVSSKKAFTVHPTDKPSCCTSSKRPVLPEVATDFLRRMDLEFCSVFGTSSTIGRTPLPDDTTRLRFCVRSTWGMFPMPRLLFTDPESSATDMNWLLRFCTTLVIQLTFRPMTGSKIDEGATENKFLLSDQTKWYCCSSKHPQKRFVIWRGS